MLNITPLGWIHTILGLIAVVAGFAALIGHRQIDMASGSGRAFFWLTAATAVTGLFIFRHGGFGVPHVLSLLTLAVLALGWFGERRGARGGFWRHVAVVSYLLALFFHFIPGFTETLIRVPIGDPWASGIEDPRLRQPIGAAFVVFLVAAVWQVLRVRRLSVRSGSGADLA
jgi:uncharacterized membrane protein